MNKTNSPTQLVKKLLALKRKTRWSWMRMADEFNQVHGGVQGVTGPTLFRYAKGTSRPRNEMLHRYVMEALSACEGERPDSSSGVAHREVTVEDLTAFFDLSPDMLCIASETHFLKLNPAWERVLGWSLEELKSKPWLEFVHPDDVDPTRQVAERMKKTDLSVTFENRYRHKDGGYRRLAWKASRWRQGKTFVVGREVPEHG